MRRRILLRATAGALSCPLAAAAARRSAAQSTIEEPLGSVAVDGLTEVVTSEDGTTAFVAATTGFAAVDVSGPANPTVLAERRDPLADREGGPLAGIRDVKAADDRLIVVGPANPGGGNGLAGMVLYDVSDPANPQRVAFHETDYAIHNAFIRGEVAYLSRFEGSETGLVLVDVSGADPERIGYWSIVEADERWADVPPHLRTVHDVWVQDGVAYVAHWDAGTWLLDVSDPGSIEAIAQVRGRPVEELTGLSGSAAGQQVTLPPGNDHYAAVNDDASVLGVGIESWARTDPSEPTASGSNTTVGADATTAPEATTEPSAATGPDGSDTEAPGGIHLFDVSTPSEPRELATIDAPPTDDPTYGGIWTTAHNFEFQGGRLYSAWYRGGVKVHDVSDPSAPAELAHWRDTDAASFWGASLAVPGEFFVGGSWNQYGELSQAELLTFRDPAREGSAGTIATTETGNASATTPGRSSAAGDDTTDTIGTGTTTATDGPGFGVPAALAGLGVGAWYRCRRRE